MRTTSSSLTTSTTGTPLAITGCSLMPPSIRALVWSLIQASVYATASETLFIITCWTALMRCWISGELSHFLAWPYPDFPLRSNPLAIR